MASTRHPTRARWILAAFEALGVLWLLMIGLFVFGIVLRQPEVFGGEPIPLERRPELSRWMLQILPQHSVSVLLGLPGLALGFAAVTMVSAEPLSSRLFRWLVIAMATLGFAAFIPLSDRVMPLSYGVLESPFDWSELLVSLAGVIAAFAGVWYARRLWP